MREVAERYGIDVTSQGFSRCPFHSDSKPSMKVYDGHRGWWCFVCGEGGDVIDFTAKLFGLEGKDAAKKLSADFGLGYADVKPDFEVLSALKAERQERQLRNDCDLFEYWGKAAEASNLQSIVTRVNCKYHFQAQVVANILARLAELEYYFETTDAPPRR